MRFQISFRHTLDSHCPGSAFGCHSPYCNATLSTPASDAARETAKEIREERKQRFETPDPFAGLVATETAAWKVQSTRYAKTSTSPRCICERHAVTRKLYLYRERGEALMGSHDWRILQDGFRTYNALPKWERSDWLRSGEWGARHVAAWFEMLETQRAIEGEYDDEGNCVVPGLCPATVHFPTFLRDEWYGNDVETSADEARQCIDAERFETLEFRRHRSHGLPWHEGYDDDSPYARDPQLVLSKAAWDREYAKPHMVKETVATGGWVKGEQMRDVEGGTNVITVWRPQYAEAERQVMGAVEWEYRRRAQGREPWMHPATYKWCRELERARALNQRRRARIAQLIRALGGDPRQPEVAAWVTERGYEAALRALEARAAREGVAV